MNKKCDMQRQCVLVERGKKKFYEFNDKKKCASENINILERGQKKKIFFHSFDCFSSNDSLNKFAFSKI